MSYNRREMNPNRQRRGAAREMTPEERRRARKRAELKRKRRRQRQIKRAIYLGILALIVFLILFGIGKLIFGGKKVKAPTVEAGQALNISDFVSKQKLVEQSSFVTDISTIDVNTPGTYDLTVKVKEKTYDTTVTIKDTTAPTAEPADVNANVDVIPAADRLVTNIQDVQPVTVSYKKQPDVSKEGATEAIVTITDASGNYRDITVPLTVISDTEPPVITGAADLEAYTGDTVSYKKDITVTDDKDPNPTLEVDNSKVDLEKEGEYEVVYTAYDSAGNTSTATVTLKVTQKPETYVEPDVVLALAKEVWDSISKDCTTDLQKTFAIYNWVNTHIAYTGTSDKTSWTRGAYDAFTNRSGDCYNYFAAAKALYEVAGIQNIDVIKSDTSHSRHYWSLVNLGDGWYHVDCTPRTGSGDNFFMVTDAELLAYSEKHKDSHVFDGSLYPERATESIQSKVNYSSRTLKE